MAERGPTFRRRLQGLGQDARPCFPVALYMDGVRFTKSIMPGHMDSLLNITVCNLATQTRHFTGMLRKSEFCRCGCLGWCTLYPLWAFLAWCFRQGRARVQSPQRHEGTPWPEDSPTCR